MLCFLELFFCSFRAQFGDPALVENTRTDLKQLKQGNMSVKEYSAAFRTIAVKLLNWPEGLLVDYYREGLNIEILGKASEHANPHFLVGWIQAATEVEAQLHLICSLKQSRAPSTPSSQQKSLPLPIGKKQAPQAKPDATWEQRFKSGHCLTCGGIGHFAAQCPLSAPMGNTPGQAR